MPLTVSSPHTTSPVGATYSTYFLLELLNLAVPFLAPDELDYAIQSLSSVSRSDPTRPAD